MKPIKRWQDRRSVILSYESIYIERLGDTNRLFFLFKINQNTNYMELSTFKTCMAMATRLLIIANTISLT